MSTRRATLMRLAVQCIALAMLAVACSGTTTTTISETSSANDNSGSDTETAQDPEPTAEQAPEPTAVPPTAAPEPTAEPTATPEPVPEPEPVFWGSELEPGTCINRLPGNPEFEQPEIISCDDFHQEEIFAKAELDIALGEPYPGEDRLADIVDSELCEQETPAFAGEQFDLLPFDTFLLYPSENEWDAGDRFVFCSATSVEGVAFKIGTAAGGTIDTDDVLIGRSGLSRTEGEFDDWVVLTEHATLDTMGTLTDGQFDLQLRRPFALADGFVFDARLVGDEAHANSTWGISWADGEVRDLGSIRDGAEQSGTMLGGTETAVYAARDEDSDWDLFVTSDGTTTTLAGGSGDQQYPTFTPDFEQVVFHDQGDLWVTNVDGTGLRQLTSSAANDWESVVSPDGRTVVFASDRSGNDDLWSIPIDGSSEPVNLTNHPGDESWPFFNADGSLIYFSSDRLDPVDDRSRIMVMEPDGSNQSWFVNVQSSQAMLVPAAFADDMLKFAPTLDERYNYELIEGEPGTVTTWTHSSGRLTAELPVGWRVGEFNEVTGFLVAERPRDYFDVWETDGVLVELFDDDTQDEFFARVDETAAVQSCERFDGTDGIEEIESGILALAANHNCGSNEAIGGVLAFYNTETGVGMLVEGQVDGLPDRAEDNNFITDIARSLIWG